MHVSYEKAPRSRKGKGGKVSGKRYGGNVEVAGGSCQPETAGILKPHRVSSNPRLAASENVKLVRGRRSLWKNGPAAAFLFVLFAHMFCPGYPPILWINCQLLCESRHRSPQPQRPNVVSEWARKRNFTASLI